MEGTVEQPVGVDLPRDVSRIGTDADDRTHWFSAYHHTVFVVAGESVVHAERLDHGALPEWVEFITEELGGWQDCHYSEDGPQTLANRVKEGL